MRAKQDERGEFGGIDWTEAREHAPDGGIPEETPAVLTSYRGRRGAYTAIRNVNTAVLKENGVDCGTFGGIDPQYTAVPETIGGFLGSIAAVRIADTATCAQDRLDLVLYAAIRNEFTANCDPIEGSRPWLSRVHLAIPRERLVKPAGRATYRAARVQIPPFPLASRPLSSRCSPSGRCLAWSREEVHAMPTERTRRRRRARLTA